MNRRDVLAWGFWTGLVGKVFAGSSPTPTPPEINPNNLAVVKFHPDEHNLIVNEFDIFGKMPWKKFLGTPVPGGGVYVNDVGIETGETYLWDKPYHDQTWDSHAWAVRETVVWLPQKDMMEDGSYNLFWGETKCRIVYKGYSYYCGSHERAHGPTVFVNFQPTENSHWLRLNPRTKNYYRSSQYKFVELPVPVVYEEVTLTEESAEIIERMRQAASERGRLGAERCNKCCEKESDIDLPPEK